MNDPHVVALNYAIVHGDTIDYSSAAPLCRDEPGFRLTVENGKARFEFREHHATEEQARAALAEYIRVWEFDATLGFGNPDSFRLQFQGAEIVDRHPTPGAVRLGGRLEVRVAGSAKLTRSVTKYPSPPSDIALNPDVETMHRRYTDCRQGREPLPTMAYFCLTVLERSVGGRRQAALTYRIEERVLDRIGNLATNKGGPEARKACGAKEELSPQERHFLIRAVKAIVRRAAETAHSPGEALPLIAMSDMPSPDGVPDDG